jgi:hypothetical protein
MKFTREMLKDQLRLCKIQNIQNFWEDVCSWSFNISLLNVIKSITTKVDVSILMGLSEMVI